MDCYWPVVGGVGDPCYKITEQYSSTFKVIIYKESLRNCHDQKGSKETLQPKVMWYAGWDLGTE